MKTYLERDVFVSKTDLKFLTPVLVLLWPFGIVFPVVRVSQLHPQLFLRPFYGIVL